MVSRVAKARGLGTRVLKRRGPAITADIEGEARSARYRLLFAACREEGATHLLVAHHRDDVAETFLMRLRRSAGVFGLAAMRPAIRVGDVTLARPFLDVPKARLAATTAAAGLKPVADPMNDDPRLARTSARRQLARGSLDPALLAVTARRFADLAETIDADATALIATAVAADAFGVVWLDPARFRVAPEPVRMRVLVRIILAVSGDDYPPRFQRVAALEAAIRSWGVGASLKRTLGGVVAEAAGGRIAFYREAGRAGLPAIRIRAGQSVTWDGRFLVTGPTGMKGASLELGALGTAGRADVRRRAGAALGDLPPGAVAALPVLRRRGKIVAFPRSLGLKGDVSFAIQPRAGKRLKQPPLFPDFDAV